MSPRHPRLVIVESPFAGATPGEREANRRYLSAALRDCLVRGEAPIASHAIYTLPGVLRDDLPTEREWGIAAGFAWRRVADATVIYADRGVSRGMLAGLEDAIELGRSRGATGGRPHVLEYRSIEEWRAHGPSGP